MKMKRILAVFLLLIIVCCSCGRGRSSDWLGEPKLKNLRQVITADNKTTRTIMWNADTKDEHALLKYRANGGGVVRHVNATVVAFRDGQEQGFQYTAKLTKLEPGSHYKYMVTSGGKSSKWHDLLTEGKSDFEALIFPDSQSNDYGEWERLAHMAMEKHPEAEFFFNMGDLVDNGEDAKQWDAWFSSLSGVIDGIPIAPVMGNHETYDLKWKVRSPKAYLQFFDLPDNGLAQYKNQFYSFDYGDVHFTVLDTQFEELKELQPQLASDQLAWLEKDLAAATKTWKVVLMHKDVLRYTGKRWPDRQPGISAIGQMFMPIFDKYGVDAVLTAHYHTYRRRGRIYNFNRATDKGPLYIITGVAGNVRYPGLWTDHPLDVAIAPQPETDNYMTLEATDKHLRFTCYLPDGTEIDKAELLKS